MKPLIFLELRHLVNSIRYAARRPKRLIPIVIIGLWVLVSVVQGILMAERGSGGFGDTMALLQDKDIPLEIIEPVLVVLLTIGSAAILYGAFSSGLLVFSLAQIDFLFPLPVSRVWVLVFRLARDYLKYALWVVFLFTVLGTSAFGALGLAFLPSGLISIMGLIALIVLMVNLAHVINIVFTFGFAHLVGLGRLAKSLLVLIPLAVTAYVAYICAVSKGDAAMVWESVNSWVVQTVLAPVKVCAQLMLAPLRGVAYPDDYLLLGFLCTLAMASFLLLVTRRENIYEPSLGTSVRFAARREAVRSGDYARMLGQTLAARDSRRLAATVLRPFGRGATAFLWKNLLVRFRIARSQALFLIALPLLVLILVKVFARGNNMVHHLPVAVVYGIWIMAMSLHLDARSELRYANTSKSIPVEAWKVVLAQSLAYAAFLAAAALVFGAAMLILLPQTRTLVAAACLVAAPFVGFATIPAVLIPSMLYPDTRDSVQNYLCGIVSTLLSMLSVVPGTVAAGLLWFAAGLSPALTVGVSCLIYLATGVVGIGVAGLVFESFEPTAE